MSIMDYFPSHITPRPEQTELLLAVEDAWKHTDVFSIVAPTATGKTAVAITIAKWAYAKHRQSSNILMPTNILVEQAAAGYSDVVPFFKEDRYENKEVYREAREATRKSHIRLMNYHLYLAHRMYAPVMICDESHKLLDVLDGAGDVKLWKSTYNFPDDIKHVSDVIIWIQAHQNNGVDPKLAKALQAIINIRDYSIVVYQKEYLRGKLDTVLVVKPSTIRFIPPFMWPKDKVTKIILLSATAGKKDVQELGIGNRRVTNIVCHSPIPPKQRRVFYTPTCNMAYKYLTIATQEVAKKLTQLLAKHPNDKGLVHMPYSIATLVRPLCADPRLIFHDREDKADQLAVFRASTEPLVLVASGMYEGVDLPYDEARWQVIAKMPFANLSDPAIKAKMENNPDWYAWDTIKKVVQAAGRIVRHPDDFGVTYILDTSFHRLWLDDMRRDPADRLFPKYFLDSLILQERT